MNYACPHCAADLRQRKPRKSETVTTIGRLLVCPACGGALKIHPHPAEKLFFPGVLVAILGLNIYSGFSGVKLALEGAAIMLALIFAAAYVVRHLVPPSNWPRYEALPSGGRKA